MPSAVEVFRDFVVEGVPSSGPHSPIKADIRALFTDMVLDRSLTLGPDANTSNLRFGSVAMSIGRTEASESLDFYNVEGDAGVSGSAFRFLSDEGEIATLSSIGSFEAKSVSARKPTFGTFEQATTAWVMANPRVNNAGRPAVLGFNTPSEISTYWDRDSVGLYVDNYARPVGIGVANCTFTATRVTLGNPLASSLRAYLRVGMIIDTRHSPNKYSGFITDWDKVNGTWIEVAGWFKVVAKGTNTGGDASSGQVPVGPQTIDINPQTKTWAINANLWTDPSSQRGTGSIVELGFFNGRANFDYTDEDTHTYGTDIVNIGTYAVGWGLSVRSTTAASRINIGAEVFGAKLGSFISSVDRLPAGTFPFYGFVSRADGGKAFGVNTVADVPVFSVDAVSGEARIGASDGYTRAGAAVPVSRNGFRIAGGASGMGAVMAAYGVDTNIDALFQAKGAGVVSIGGVGNKLSFFGGANAVKQTVNGSRGGNAALASLLTTLAGYGLITDSTIA